MTKTTLVSLLVASFISSTQASTKKEQLISCQMLPQIEHGFVMSHILAKKSSMEFYEGRTIEQFIKKLDSSKIYFLEHDVELLRSDLRGISKRLGKDCSQIEKTFGLYVLRLEEATTFVKKTLSDPKFKFEENTEIVFDPNQRTFPKTKKEWEDQLTKFLQFQISNYLASDMKLPEAKKQLSHRYEVNLKRQKETSRDEMYSIFLDSFASSLDAHSGYLSQEVLEDFEISMRLSLEGIGAALSWEDGYTTVESLIPGGSAEKSGEIKPKDKIISVAQGNGAFEQVIDMPLRDVVRLIRGKKGTTVRLNLLRKEGATTKRFIVALLRDKISLQDEAAKLTITNKKIGDKTYKIGIIDLPSFYGDLIKKSRSCYDDMKKVVEQASKEKVDALVLDLSKNGGGLLTEAVRIGGLFIKRGNIVATQSQRESMEYLADEDDEIQYKGPLVVLTSRLSASASEIVSGALQDYKRAVIVGADQTFGKGTVQAMMNLPSQFGGGAIKVTTGLFFVPSGNSTQYRGVPADVVLPSVFSTKEIGEISLDYSLQPSSVKAFTSPEAAGQWKALDSTTLKKLKEKSLYIAIVTTIVGVISVGINLYTIVVLRMGYLGWFISIFTSSFLSLIFYVAPLHIKYKFRPVFSFNFKFIKRYLKVSLPTIPHNYSTYLYTASDRIILDRSQVPIQDIGKYNFAYTFGNYVEILSGALGMAISPLHLRLFAKKDHHSQEIVRKLTFFTQVSFLAGALFLCLWIKEIFSILVNNDDLQSSYPYAIFIIMACSYAPMYYSCVNLLFYHEKTNQLWKITFIGGIINILLNIIFIPFIGIYASIGGTFIALMYVGYAGYYMKLFKSLSKVNYYPTVWILITLAASGTVYFLVELNWSIKLLITLPALIAYTIYFLKSYKALKNLT